MLTWLFANADWLGASVFVAMVTAALIGLKDGAKGGAILVSAGAGVVLDLVLFPVADKFGYGGPFAPLLGLVSGALGLSAIGVLTSVRETVDGRRTLLGKAIVDRVLPETKT